MEGLRGHDVKGKCRKQRQKLIGAGVPHERRTAAAVATAVAAKVGASTVHRALVFRRVRTVGARRQRLALLPTDGLVPPDLAIMLTSPTRVSGMLAGAMKPWKQRCGQRGEEGGRC